MKVESDVPPPKYTGQAWNTKYPWREMKVNDSILADNPETARRAAQGFARRHKGWRFTCRMEGDKLRIWCIARPPTLDSLPARQVFRLGSW